MQEESNLSADDRPTILLVEEDVHAHRPVKSALRRKGYRVLAVLDVEDASDWLSATSPPADLMLLNLVGKPEEESLEVGRRLRRHASHDGDTPLVVMAEQLRPGLAGQDVQVGGNDWISYYEDADQLHRLLGRLLPTPQTAAEGGGEAQAPVAD